MILLIGIAIGMFVSLPVGPLGLLAIQRTINKGWKIGLLSGMGAAFSDFVYSSIAILGISFIDNFVRRHIRIINGITGSMFLIIGINILISGIEKGKLEKTYQEEKIHPFFVHFLMGLSNPMTFIIFFAIFTKIGIYAYEMNMIQNILFIMSIFLGSSLLWLITANLIEHSKRFYNFDKFVFVDKIIGILIILFGVVSIFKGMI